MEIHEKGLDKDHQTIVDFIYEDVRDKYPDFSVIDNFSIFTIGERIKVKLKPTKETKDDLELLRTLERTHRYLSKPSTTLQDVERELKKMISLRQKNKEH